MVEAEEILNPAVKAPAIGGPPSQPRSRTEILNSQFEALRVYHRAVLETEAVEAIHKMRVTTRRLQASLDLLAREVRVRKLKRRLRGWRRKLSTVRNYDVFLELIEKESASRGRNRREQLELVKAILHQRRYQRAAKVNRFLQGINVDVIALGLAESCSAPELAGVIDESQNEKSIGAIDIDEHRVAGYAAERLEQRLAEFQVMAVQSLPTNNPSELHQLRIAAKRVRYLLEIVMVMGFGDASRALAWLRTLQDRIGDWHDLEALEAEIIDIVSSPEFMKQHLAESSQMLQAAAHIQRKKEALVSRLFPVRVPRYVELTSRRIVKALRRHSIRSLAPS
jgi:CHAD domain-containing protein